MMMEAIGALRAMSKNTSTTWAKICGRGPRIHAGDAEARGIYGEATPAEVRALEADGVPVAPLPPAGPRKAEMN